MHDTLPYREGTINLNHLKQWTSTSFPQNQSRRSSLSSSQASDNSDSSSVSSDGSSQGTNDSDYTAATSISPDAFDQFGLPHIADIFTDDGLESSCHLSDSIPTAPLVSPQSDKSALLTGPRSLDYDVQHERLHSKRTDIGSTFDLKLTALHGEDENSSANRQNKVYTVSKAEANTHTLPEGISTSFGNVARLSQGCNQFAFSQSRDSNTAAVTFDNVVRRDSGISQEGKVHPRRTRPQSLRPPPTLQRQEQRRHTYVDALVEITMRIIAKIWPSSCHPVQLIAECGGQQPLRSNPVICLRYFVEEVLKRSRTSHSTLQVALYYCYKLGRSGKILSAESARLAHHNPSSRFLQCGRRMFLCSLILASKFIQDRNYSTRAWSKISSLPITEINQCETAMLRALNYRIFIKVETFAEWSRQTTLCVEQIRLGVACPFGNLDKVVDADILPMKTTSTPVATMSPIFAGSSSSTENISNGQTTTVQRKMPAMPAELLRRRSDDTFTCGIPPIPSAPHLSNASSPSSSPDSDSGHLSTNIGSIIHWNTSHPTIGIAHTVGLENVLRNGLLTPTSTSAGSVDEAENVTSISVGGVELSPHSRALDAQAWSELRRANSHEVTSSSPESVISVPETPVRDDATVHEDEAYLAQNSWVEDAEDDLMRQLERRTENRKPRQQPVSMQRKRSIGRCLGNQVRHHSGRGEKKPCRK